jgi:hypothetical protein
MANTYSISGGFVMKMHFLEARSNNQDNQRTAIAVLYSQQR